MVTTYIGIDPGKISGFAVIWNGRLAQSAELEMLDLGNLLDEVISESSLDDVVVLCERFNQTPGPVTGGPWSLEVTGMCRYVVSTHRPNHGRSVTFSTDYGPSDSKTTATDRVLRYLGLQHRGGEGHANDAVRQVVHHMIVSRLFPDDVIRGIMRLEDG